MDELWRPIPNFEDLYEISSLGRVKSLERLVDRGDKGKYLRRERLLKTPLDRYGYKKLTLQKDGVKIFTTIHRQVAITFIPNPTNLPQVNHKDGNKINNNFKNLEWCTVQYNTKHAYDNNLIDVSKISGENCYITNLTNEIVKDIREKMANGIRNKDIQKEYGLSRSAVSRLRMNKSFKNI